MRTTDPGPESRQALLLRGSAFQSREAELITSLHTYKLDGLRALEALVAASPYGTLENAVAALTVFSHPDTVKQTAGKPLIRVVRSLARRGEIGELQGTAVGYDDNKSPTDTFLWCNGIERRPADVQFNHVHAASQDPESYTCLANLCMGPAFLAKLTDTHVTVRRMLEYRAFALYGWHPTHLPEPTEPEGYTTLAWADTLPPVAGLPDRLKSLMAKRPKDRTVLLARRLGWLFGEPAFVPSETVSDTDVLQGSA